MKNEKDKIIELQKQIIERDAEIKRLLVEKALLIPPQKEYVPYVPYQPPTIQPWNPVYPTVTWQIDANRQVFQTFLT